MVVLVPSEGGFGQLGHSRGCISLVEFRRLLGLKLLPPNRTAIPPSIRRRSTQIEGHKPQHQELFGPLLLVLPLLIQLLRAHSASPPLLTAQAEEVPHELHSINQKVFVCLMYRESK